MKLRPYQQEAVDAILAKFAAGDQRTICVLPTGGGKCLGKGTPVMGFFGNVMNVEDVVVGDYLMGPDSKPRVVTSTCHGRGLLYRITPTKGDPYVVNEDHILTLKITGRTDMVVYSADGRRHRGGDIVDICVRDYLASSKTFKHCAKGFRVGVNFPTPSPLAKEPYFVGLWLGDGTTNSAEITTADHEVVGYLRKLALSHGLHLRRRLQNANASSVYRITWRPAQDDLFSHPIIKQNPLRKLLVSMGMLGNKHLPDAYKFNTTKVRAQVLAGLIDADGHADGKGGFDFVSSSKKLAEDCAFLARSLGLAAYVHPCRKQCVNNGVWGDYYRVYISGHTNIIPTRIARKKMPPRRQKKDVLVTGITVEPIGEGDYYGFTITGDGRFLLGDFTVTHNTVVMAHVCEHFRDKGRIMLIAHRDELLRQAAEKFHAVTGIMPAVEKADERSDEHGMLGKPPIVVASVQTLISGRGIKRMQRFNPKDFALILIDECFPAGTLVDGRPIETVRAGDHVRTFNHQTGEVEMRRVSRTMKTKPKMMVTVITGSRALVCTASHPIYCREFQGYVPAMLVQAGWHILTERTPREPQDLFSVRNRVHPEVVEPLYDPILLRGMQGGEEEGEGQGHDPALYELRGRSASHGPGIAGTCETGTGVLLRDMQGCDDEEGTVRDREPHQPPVRVCPHDAQQPDVAARSASQGVVRAEGNELGADSARGERARSDCAGAGPCRCLGAGMGDQRDRANWHARHGHTDPLQVGHRQPDGHGGGGGGRELALPAGQAGTGCQEDGVLEWSRVDGVEVHEPAGGHGFDGLCPDGYVYNLEVDEHHNYFANGVLVHNCHHATADSYVKPMAWFCGENPDVRVLGVSATPDRADGEALGQVFQSVAYDYELPDIIRDGYLVPIHQTSVFIEGLDFSRVHTLAGDFKQDELEAAMMFEKPLHGVAHATIELACGLKQGTLDTIKDAPDREAKLAALLGRRRQTLLFAVSVAHAERMAEVINRWLPGSAGHVSGAMTPDLRRATMQSFSSGTLQFLCNCMIVTEGVDLPGVDVVVMARPTKSRPLYSQMVGRGTRPSQDIARKLGELETPEERRALIAASSKQSMEVLDFVGNTGKHKLVCTADLLGEGYAEDVIARAKEKAAMESVDVLAALAKAQEEIKQEKDELERKKREAEAAAKKREEEQLLRQQAEAARRAKLVATSQYTTRSRNALDPFAPLVQREDSLGERPAYLATDKQVKLLVALGLSPQAALRCHKKQAGKILSERNEQGVRPDWTRLRLLEAHQKAAAHDPSALPFPDLPPRGVPASSGSAKPHTPAQAALLARAGYRPEQIAAMSYSQAIAALSQKVA